MKQKSQNSRSLSITEKIVKFKFIAPVFGDLVTVLVTLDDDIIRKHLRDFDTTEDSIDFTIDNKCCVSQFEPEEGALLILRPARHLTWSVLFHEIEHIQFFIMHNAGSVLSPESEEDFTYFGGDLFALIEEGLRYHKVKIWPSMSIETLGHAIDSSFKRCG